ncbi:concanavalin A-like lectin/glucanase domain-containing protein [Lipomyces japonicus]|uniref:concanavalin A-like lectin/glucanase domain-containing protein n=1 Tax=Lipomyces japonicus TaxID=56871 RepID=UPI0034CEC48A
MWQLGLLALCSVGFALVDPKLSLPTPISQDRITVPGFDKVGSVVVESDRIFLTSPGEKGQSGAIWSQATLGFEQWTTDLTFRASGSERPGGGIVLWYAAQAGQQGPVYGSRDLWDGLAVVVDSVADGKGTVRGHLNDGTISYAGLSNPAGQAFASCGFKYRNTGSVVKIGLQVTGRSVKVEVDGRDCFSVDGVHLPPDLHLGVSASSFDVPDTFEIFGIDTVGSGKGKVIPPVLRQQQQNQKQQQQAQQKQRQEQKQQIRHDDNDDHDLQEQLNQLTRLVQANTDAITSLQSAINANSGKHDAADGNENVREIIRSLVERLDQRLGRIETTTSRTESQLHGATVNMHETTKQNVAAEIGRLADRLDGKFESVIKEHAGSIFTALRGVTEAKPSSPSSVSLTVLLLTAAVVALVAVAAYAIYKRWRANHHAKFL